MTDRCAVPGCRGEVEIVYLDHGVCSLHWNRLTAEDQPADALARALGIAVAEATTKETDMSESKESKTPKATNKAAKPVKAAKAPTKKEPVVKDATRVFAIRVTTEELEALHRAAGERNASRFVRALTAAFVAEDAGAFKAIVEDARQARA